MTNSPKMIAPHYHVQSTAKDLRDGFPYFAYHESVSALWSRKWRPLCAAGIYPFTDANVTDFEPIFAELIAVSNDDPAILHRPDDYAKPFLPAGQRLVAEAEDASAKGNRDMARDFFLRGAAVYRIARFPINRSPLSQEAWERGKAAYEMGGRLLDPPSVPLAVPFTHAAPSAGDRDTAIQAYLRLPRGSKPASGWPVMLLICGLDAYKTDHTPRTQQHVDRGYATLSFEIPGTGDCPAAPNDPTSSDRVMSSVLDWVAATASHHELDPKKVIARGLSTGGYDAFRVAHTHADRLFAVVAQGGGCHHMFDPAWIRAQDQMEYPFALAERSRTNSATASPTMRPPSPGTRPRVANSAWWIRVSSGRRHANSSSSTAWRTRFFPSKTASSRRLRASRKTSSHEVTVRTSPIREQKKLSMNGSTMLSPAGNKCSRPLEWGFDSADSSPVPIDKFA